eukprot:7346255-Pyramimonas_sp.AAC.1
MEPFYQGCSASRAGGGAGHGKFEDLAYASVAPPEGSSNHRSAGKSGFSLAGGCAEYAAWHSRC